MRTRSRADRAAMWLGAVSLASLLFLAVKRELHFVDIPKAGIPVAIVFGLMALAGGWHVAGNERDFGVVVEDFSEQQVTVPDRATMLDAGFHRGHMGADQSGQARVSAGGHGVDTAVDVLDRAADVHDLLPTCGRSMRACVIGHWLAYSCRERFRP